MAVTAHSGQWRQHNIIKLNLYWWWGLKGKLYDNIIDLIHLKLAFVTVLAVLIALSYFFRGDVLFASKNHFAEVMAKGSG